MHLQIIVWSPLYFFWYALWRIEVEAPGTFPDCFYDQPGEMQFTSSACWLKAALEKPTSTYSVACYRVAFFAAVTTLILCRKRPLQLKAMAFWMHFLITITIRCLTTFSGYTTLPHWSSLIWNSNSIFKGLWLWLLIQNGCWAWTYLGFYADFYFDAASRTVFNTQGAPVWAFNSEKDDALPDDWYDPYWPMFLPWRDVAVRLSYIHLVDNAIHVVWLRYLAADAPYTTGINNSEIMTLLLFISLAVYTYARMRTHVVFTSDSEKFTTSMPVRSATTDLLTLNSPHHVFRKPCSARWACIALSGLAMTVAVAVGEQTWWRWLITLVSGALGILLAMGLVYEEVMGEDMKAMKKEDERKMYLGALVRNRAWKSWWGEGRIKI